MFNMLINNPKNNYPSNATLLYGAVYGIWLLILAIADW